MKSRIRVRAAKRISCLRKYVTNTWKSSDTIGSSWSAWPIDRRRLDAPSRGQKSKLKWARRWRRGQPVGFAPPDRCSPLDPIRCLPQGSLNRDCRRPSNSRRRHILPEETENRKNADFKEARSVALNRSSPLHCARHQRRLSLESLKLELFHLARWRLFCRRFFFGRCLFSRDLRRRHLLCRGLL